jgi:hypothetical protein
MASDRGGKVTGEVPISMMPSRSRRLSNSISNSRRESFSYPSAGFGTNPLESASRQSNHDYDEEALRWAALEKLPTYDRIRTSVFQKHTGSVRQVDVKDLSMTDFQHLLEKVHRNQEDENEQLVFKMRKRLDRYKTNDFLEDLFPICSGYIRVEDLLLIYFFHLFFLQVFSVVPGFPHSLNLFGIQNTC